MKQILDEKVRVDASPVPVAKLKRSAAGRAPAAPSPERLRRIDERMMADPIWR